MLITFIISITSVVLQVTSEPRLASVWISWFTHAFTPQVLIDAYCLSGPRDTGLNKTEHDVIFMSLPALTFFSPAGAGERQNWAVGEVFYRASFPLTPVLFLSTHNPRTAQISQSLRKMFKAIRDFIKELSQGYFHLKGKVGVIFTPKEWAQVLIFPTS